MTTKYTNDHEWARVEQGSDIVTIGITDYAQKQLGDVVFVELPDVGDSVSAEDNVAVVESVKAAGDVKAPLDGVVAEVNEELEDTPELVNESPTDRGWFYKVTASSVSDLDSLMDEDAYKAYVESLE